MGKHVNSSKGAGVLHVLAIFAALVTLALCIVGLKMDPILFSGSEEHQKVVSEFFDSVASSDYTKAESMFYGTVKLGLDEGADSDVGKLLLQANANNFSYELRGEPKIEESSTISQAVICKYLDVRRLMTDVNELAKKKLTLAVQNAEDAENLAAVYKPNGEYREEFVMNALNSAVSELLETGEYEKTSEITVGIISDVGIWKIIPSDDLLNVFFGGTIY